MSGGCGTENGLTTRNRSIVAERLFSPRQQIQALRLLLIFDLLMLTVNLETGQWINDENGDMKKGLRLLSLHHMPSFADTNAIKLCSGMFRSVTVSLGEYSASVPMTATGDHSMGSQN